MSLFTRPQAEIGDPTKLKQALEAALKVSEIAASATALPDAVHAVVATAIDLFGAQKSSIMLLDDGGRELVLVASAGQAPGVPLGHRMPCGDSVAGRVVATGQALLLGDVDQEAFINYVPKKKAISSSVVAPLRVNGRAIGVLNLSISDSSHTFTQDDRRLAQMFADQAAALIHRTKLHEQAERRSSDLAALNDANNGLMGMLDIETLLNYILDGATRLASEKEGFVCLFDGESGALSRGVFRGLDKTVIRVLTERPETRAAIEETGLRLIDMGDGSHFVAIGLRSPRGTRGLIMVSGSEGLVQERGYVLKAYGQQCSSAIGAGEMYSVAEHKESELSSIIQSVPNPLVLSDAAGRIRSINAAAEQLFGLTAMFASGTPVRGSLGSDQLEDLILGEGNLLDELQIGSAGRTYKVHATDVRVPGAPMGRLLVMDDVTPERKMAQTQHDFVAMIGHELRTPLTIVRGFTNLLKRRVDQVSREESLEALDTIEAKAGQLESLIEDLLYVSKIESREAKLRIEQADVVELVRRVANDVLTNHSDRELNLDMPHNLKWSCDEMKVGLVLRHLIDNALKYSDAPEPVTVQVTEDGNELRFDVIDRGIGIVSSDIPHIFERFHQVDGSSTREHGGTGVGLYLCSQLLQVHDGRVWVDSTWGKGSTFSFSIPRGASRHELVNINGRTVQKTA
ncbi:MAG: ATP-binding protein [Actinomycetota bacterium]